MLLAYRDTEPEDLDRCLHLLRGAAFYEPGMQGRLLPLWRDLLASRAGPSAVVEDQDRPPASRIIQFGLSVFVTDAFVREMKTAPFSHIGSELLVRERQGHSPILRPPAIGAANSGPGLNLLLVYYGFVKGGWEDVEGMHSFEKMNEAFYVYHAGYRIKEFLMEGYELEWFLVASTAGFHLRTDSIPCEDNPGLRRPARYPFLMGVTREEASTSLGSRLLPLFLYTPPRLFFRPSEQELLLHALAGGTNVEIARALRITPSAVKKRWETIYERVAWADPELFSPSEDAAVLGQKRGAEKKDRLLHYLRRHPEELRPMRQARSHSD